MIIFLIQEVECIPLYYPMSWKTIRDMDGGLRDPFTREIYSLVRRKKQERLP